MTVNWFWGCFLYLAIPTEESIHLCTVSRVTLILTSNLQYPHQRKGCEVRSDSIASWCVSVRVWEA